MRLIFFLVILMIPLFGCGEINLSCGNAVLTKECEKIYKECDGQAWLVDPGTAIPRRSPIIALNCFKTKYEPRCGSCKRIK